MIAMFMMIISFEFVVQVKYFILSVSKIFLHCTQHNLWNVTGFAADDKTVSILQLSFNSLTKLPTQVKKKKKATYS